MCQASIHDDIHIVILNTHIGKLPAFTLVQMSVSYLRRLCAWCHIRHAEVHTLQQAIRYTFYFQTKWTIFIWSFDHYNVCNRCSVGGSWMPHHRPNSDQYPLLRFNTISYIPSAQQTNTEFNLVYQMIKNWRLNKNAAIWLHFIVNQSQPQILSPWPLKYPGPLKNSTCHGGEQHGDHNSHSRRHQRTRNV